MNKNTLIVLIIILIAVASGYWLVKKGADTGGDGSGQIVCTQDAKACPDGSFVSRTGTNCEFAACPEGKTKDTNTKAIDASNWQTYRNEEYGFEVKYPNEWQVEDLKIGIALSPPGLDMKAAPNVVLARVISSFYPSKSLDDIYFCDSCGLSKDSCDKVEIDGRSAYSCHVDSYVNERLYVFSRGTHIFELSDPIQNEVTRQIFSTFKFTK